MTRSSRLIIGSLVMAATIGLYVVSALDSPVLNADRRHEQQRLLQERAAAAHDEADERALAEAYWTRYPDVAKSDAFGRGGQLGVYGAREHYQRYGRTEGRKWGLE